MSRPAARAVRTGAETWTRIRSSSILRGGVEVGGVLRVEEVVAPEPGGECVRTHALATQRPCEGCGSDFTPRRLWQRHCTPRCRQRAFLERRVAAAVASRIRTSTEATS